jgi:UDPglucose 6-dehydrogenase
MREAPSRIIIQGLVKRGARVQAYDPVASIQAQHCLEEDLKNNHQGQMQVAYGETMQSVLKHADALIIVTEWKAFRSPDFEFLKQELRDLPDGIKNESPSTVEQKSSYEISINMYT